MQADCGEDETLEVLNQVVEGTKALGILALLNLKQRSNLRGLNQRKRKKY